MKILPDKSKCPEYCLDWAFQSSVFGLVLKNALYDKDYNKMNA